MKKLAFGLTLATISFSALAAHLSDVMVVKPGQKELVVKLSSNPSTGYSWFLDGYNKDFLKPVGYRYRPGNTKMIGSGGTAEFSFDVSSSFNDVPQATMLTFSYNRPWEKAGEPSKIITVYSIAKATEPLKSLQHKHQSQLVEPAQLPSAKKPQHMVMLTAPSKVNIQVPAHKTVNMQQKAVTQAQPKVTLQKSRDQYVPASKLEQESDAQQQDATTHHEKEKPVKKTEQHKSTQPNWVSLPKGSK